ncbi:putative S1 domain, nucleic acid-binding, RNA-binding domain, S1 [Helianthus annuus]|nr:putative S1 domain, nucleic acid-binding, RNA-binding domain, S1 [Helianthus annuus]
MCSITATTSNASYFGFCTPCYINPKTCKNLTFSLKQQTKVVVFAANNKLRNWDQMELKFDKLIHENPKLTLAKIKDGKSNTEHDKGNRPKEPLVKAPNVILWKSTTFDDSDVGSKMSSSLSLKPNLSLQMGKEDDKERFSRMVLVSNLEPLIKNNEVETAVNIKESTCQTEKVDQAYVDHKRPKNLDSTSETGKVAATDPDQSQKRRDIAAEPVSEPSPDATLQGRPKRSLGQPVKEIFGVGGRNTKVESLIPYFATSENLLPGMFMKDDEETDWKRAQDMIKTTGRGEVELISCSTQGFVVSFGCLIGFLPYRHLATKWKFLAFESWLRAKGFDPATYKKSLGVVGNFDATSVDREKIEGEISSNMKLEDLFATYNQEKLAYLSTFVGQKIKVNVILADIESRKLIFSVKPKEQEESIQRKRNLMAKLKVGCLVTCCITKISYFGIFVEIEGVPALIHQTEVSWDATSNPASSFKIGQVVEAKVHQLDFSLERICLSLKEITPDPLTESFEAVIGHNAVLDGTIDADQPENEWADLDSLIKGLQSYEGIELVTKGRFFLSPGLTLAFQVYMVSLFKNQYKLLVRAGNKVQEVMVQTWLDTEEMKHAILLCYKRIDN